MTLRISDYSDEETEYSFNMNGAMTQDLNKGIENIEYNYLNLPQEIVINQTGAQGKAYYTYSATGQKLRVVREHASVLREIPVTGLSAMDVNQTDSVDYVGNFIYENDSLKRILVEGGYIEGGNYYFYITDHLGNNRIVANANGEVVQSNEYYPFGLLMATSTEADKQPYKYGNKELDSYNGLNLYDFEARYFDSGVPSFTTQDPLSEKYYNISPYAYVANNPLRYVDYRGDSISVAEALSSNFVVNKAFELFAGSKAGRQFLADYASKGQTIAGNTFKEDGKYHKKGINLNYTASATNARGYTNTSDDGSITITINSLPEIGSQDGNTYNWSMKNFRTSKEMANQMTHGVLSKAITFFHESFIHADQDAQDFSDNGLFDNSHIPSYIKEHTRFYNSSNKHLHHMNVYHNNNNKLWPGAALRGIIEINSKFGQRYTNKQLKKMMWNYNGGR